jgi:hypothetical protein
MRSARIARALGLALVVGALVSGCGSEVASTPQQPGASPPVQPNYSGLTVHSLEQAGFSIGVPTGWTTMTGEDADRASLDAIVTSDPTLGPQRNLLTMPDSPIKFIALKYDLRACSCSTISIMTFPLNDNWKDNFAAEDSGFLDGVQKLALPGTTPTSQPMKTPIASGVRITMRTTAPGTEIEVIMTQYYLRTGTAVFILSYTASPDASKTYARLFDRSVQSLREV